MIHILQNDPIVPPGTCIPHLEGTGMQHHIVRLFAGDPLPPLGASGLIVLGGTMGVRDTDRFPFLAPLMAFLREAALRDTPLLGICLGGQLLAAALGAKVHSGARGEHGMHRVTATERGADPLLAGLPPSFAAFQWHNDSFEIPQGAVHLAFSKGCPGQIFRFRRAYGLQFHPEVDETIVAGWVAACGADPSHLDAFRQNRGRIDGTASALFDGFLRVVRGDGG